MTMQARLMLNYVVFVTNISVLIKILILMYSQFLKIKLTLNHVNSEVGFYNFTGQPGQCRTDSTGPTGNPLATGQRTSVNFDPCFGVISRFKPFFFLQDSCMFTNFGAGNLGNWRLLSSFLINSWNLINLWIIKLRSSGDFHILSSIGCYKYWRFQHIYNNSLLTSH